MIVFFGALQLQQNMISTLKILKLKACLFIVRISGELERVYKKVEMLQELVEKQQRLLELLGYTWTEVKNGRDTQYPVMFDFHGGFKL